MSFRKIGEIALIINPKFAIIKSSEPLILGSEVLVYNEIKLSPEMAKNSGISDPSIPKGKLRILMLQSDGTYLASVITERNSRDTADNQSLARAMTLYHAVFGKEDPEISSNREKLASYSAVLDPKQSLNVEISPLVQVGDAITFVQPTNIDTDTSVKPNEQRPIS